jgi:hypothetical protein
MRRYLVIVGFLLLAVLVVTSEADALSPTCLPAPYPATPQAPVFELDLVSFGAQAHLELWRLPCTDGSGQTAALVRFTPVSQAPATCNFDFVLIQDGQQFGTRLRKTPTQTVICETLFIPVTYLLFEESGAPITFNAAATFTLISDEETIQQVSVPAISPSVVPVALTVVATGCTTCHPGNTAGYNLSITNPGGPMPAEIKGGLRLPDGTVVGIIDQEQTLPSGATVIPLVPTTVVPGGLPSVDVIVEGALLEPELGTTLSRDAATLQLRP